jgi:prevent-host-death family protein
MKGYLKERRPLMSLNPISQEMYNMNEIMYNNRRGSLMKIPATELKQNLSKYLKLAAKEPVFITKNGRVIAVLSVPSTLETRLAAIKATYGMLAGSPYMSAEEIEEARLKKYEDPD